MTGKAITYDVDIYILPSLPPGDGSEESYGDQILPKNPLNSSAILLYTIYIVFWIASYHAISYLIQRVRYIKYFPLNFYFWHCETH
jgi:hypothetical protein